MGWDYLPDSGVWGRDNDTQPHAKSAINAHRGILPNSSPAAYRFQPFHSNDQYEALRHFRQQQRDGDGRTVMAKYDLPTIIPRSAPHPLSGADPVRCRTMEHAFVYDFVRTATPEAKGNTMMHSNLSAVKKRSEQNRINHGRKRPLTDDDILKMSEIMVPSGMMHKLSEASPPPARVSTAHPTFCP